MTAISNDDLLGGSTRAASKGFDSLDNVHALLDLSKDGVLTIQPAADNGGDEELGSIGVGSSIGHRQETWGGVLQLEVLIGKLVAIDGLATGTVSSSEISSLQHELGDDAMEGTSLVGELLGVVTDTEGTEVFGGLGNDVGIELEDDAAEGGAVGGEVEEDGGVGHGGEETTTETAHALVQLFMPPTDQGTNGNC